MTRSLLACAAVLLAATVATAQPMPGVGAAQRPTFSPYLNLLNRGGNPGLNYLGIVRPQQQLQQQFNQLQQQTNQQLQSLGQSYDSQLDALSGAFLPATGNVAVFNSAPGYFGRIPYGSGIYSPGGGGSGFGGGGMGRFGGSAGAMGAMQRPGFAGGGAGGGARPAAGGGGRR
jgi:hypothetical protein